MDKLKNLDIGLEKFQLSMSQPQSSCTASGEMVKVIGLENILKHYKDLIKFQDKIIGSLQCDIDRLNNRFANIKDAIDNDKRNIDYSNEED